MESGAQEDYSQLPLGQRLVHKSWKARLGAYDEVAKKFPLLETDAEFMKYVEFLKGMVVDTNQAAQESGVAALVSFVTHAPANTSLKHVRGPIIPLVVEKVFGANRQGAKNSGLEFLMLFIELEASDAVVNAVIHGLDHKTPKNVVLAVFALKEAIRLFGSGVVNLKPILKQLPKIFDHKDAAVRQQGSELAVEMFRWMGPALLSCLSELKPIQLKDLMDLLESQTLAPPQPERFLRSAKQKESLEPKAMGKSMTEETLVVDHEMEEEEEQVASKQDFFDPVNILDKLPKNFYDDLTSSKWKERKEALDSLLKLLEAPKLEDGRYHELISSLGKRMNDANVVVVVLAANGIEKLAQGLSANFNPYRSMVLSPIVERLKEKKTNVVEALTRALDASSKFSTVDDLLDYFQSGATHKNPQVRLEVVKWIARFLSTLKKAPLKPVIKALALCLVKTMEDGLDLIREAAAEALGVLMKVAGDKAVSPFLEKLDKLKETKVREHFERLASSQSKSSTVVGNPQKSSISVPKLTSKKFPSVTKAPSKNIPPKKKTTKPPSTGEAKTTEVKSNEPQTIYFRFTDDSARQYFEEKLPEVVKEMSDSNWKVRLAAVQSLSDFLINNNSEDLSAEATVRFFSLLPGWKESNFQVMIKLIDALEWLATNCSSFDRAAASLAIPGIVEKLSDIKVKNSASKCLLAFAEHVNLGFVLDQALGPILALKSPKALADAVSWVQKAILDFGLAGVSVQRVVLALKTVLANPNQGARTAAISCLGSIHSFSKSDIRNLLQDSSSQILQLLDAEFEKMSKGPVVQPLKAPALTTLTEEPSNPKADISDLITDALLSKMSDANWKIRKEGLDELSGILEKSQFSIQYNFTHELFAVLKARLSDSNKNLVIECAEICGNLAKSVGKPLERNVRAFLEPVIGILADPKPQVRTAGLASLDKIHDAISLGPMLPTLASMLMIEHPQQRKDLLNWLAAKAASYNSLDFNPLVHPTLLCLQDRNADVRKLAQRLFAKIGSTLGWSVINDKASDLFKGTALASLSPFIDSLKQLSPPVNVDQSLEPVKSQKTVAKAAPVVKKAAARSKTVPESSTILAKKEAEMNHASFVLMPPDFKAKDTRSQADRGLHKWSFDSPRKDLLEFLSDQAATVFSAELHSMLFSEQHYKERDFLAGLSHLDEGLVSRAESGSSESLSKDEVTQRFLASSDLILKYITVRFFDTNTVMLLKVLDVLEHLLGMMDEESYLLSDYEASVFIPFFIQKTGESKETLRVKIRSLLKQLSRLYPASKLFVHVLKGLESKNSRTRAECLDEMAYLIQRNGVSVCAASKVFPAIAAMVADRDAVVRNAALGVVVQAYLLIGETIFKHVGRISDKDRSLIDERIRRLPGDSHKATEVAPKPVKQAQERAIPAKSGTSIKSKPLSPVLVKKEFSLDLDDFEAEKAPPVSNDLNRHLDSSSHSIINELSIMDPVQSIMALKLLEENLSKDPESFKNGINELMSSLCTHLHLVFTSANIYTTNGARLGKHLLNALILIFSNNDLPRDLKKEILQPCVEEILSRLVDPALSTLDQGSQLSKMMNILMVRTLQTSSPNIVFDILLDILGKASERTANEKGAAREMSSKYTELVMKCTWKLIKSIPGLLQDKNLKLDELILSVHDFLQAYPPNEWKRRIDAQIPQADMPLRTVKTILSMVFSTVGDSYTQWTFKIATPESSHAVQYLEQMARSGSKKSPTPVASKPISPKPDFKPSDKWSDADIKSKLDSIFDMISNKDETKRAIQDLHQFRTQHPYALSFIEERLAQSGNYFQGYVRRSLAHLEELEAESRPEEREKEKADREPAVVSGGLVGDSTVENKKEVTTFLDKPPAQTTDRSLAVAELKARLAKMKVNMNVK